MDMYQTYAGRVRNGRPVITESVTLPENANLFITVLEEMPSVETKTQKQLAAFERFVATNRTLNDQGIEPLDEKFDEIMARGINLGELDL